MMKRNGMILLLTLATGLVACGSGSSGNLGNSTTGNTSQSTLTPVSLSASSAGNLVGIGSSTAANASDGINTAEGIWQGITDTSRTFTSLITDNGNYWMLYSAAGNPNNLAGVVIGNSLSGNNTVTSNTGTDFNFETGSLLPLSWRGSYVAKNRLQGTLTYSNIPGGIVNLSANYNATYGLAPSLAGIAGTYGGSATNLARGSQNASLNILANGQISGSRADGCTFSGTIAPRTRGNAYSMTLTYNGSNCPDRGAYSQGTAYLPQGNKQLYSAALMYSHTLANKINDGKDVFVFIGKRP